MQHQKSSIVIWPRVSQILSFAILFTSPTAAIASTPNNCLDAGIVLTLKVKPKQGYEETSETQLQMPQQVRKILEKRIQGLGISDAVVRPFSNDGLQVFLPPIKAAPLQIAQTIIGLGRLELRQQNIGSEARLPREIYKRNELLTDRAILKANGSTAEIAKNQADLEQNQKAISSLFAPAELTGSHIKAAYAEMNLENAWGIVINFDDRGRDIFAQMTKNLAGTGRGLGFFVDEALVSAPSVPVEFFKQGIRTQSSFIQGNFTKEQANDLALQIQSGALPAPVELLSSSTFKQRICQVPGL
jgi:preprotein translocase subunit SecD